MVAPTFALPQPATTNVGVREDRKLVDSQTSTHSLSGTTSLGVLGVRVGNYWE